MVGLNVGPELPKLSPGAVCGPRKPRLVETGPEHRGPELAKLSPAAIRIACDKASHSFYESPEYSCERTMTRIHVRSHDEPSGGYRVVEGSPVNLHIHTASGQSICIEISSGRE